MILLACLLYEGKDRERIPLYRRWVSYYLGIRGHLPWDKLVFVDNASSPETIAEILSFAPDCDIMRFSERMDRKSQHEYPYCWRGMKFMQAIFYYYNPDRFLYIDPDFFVLSGDCAKALNECEDGWYSLWSPAHNFPTIECSSIHGSGFDIYKQYDVGDPHSHNDVMETSVPITPIKHLNGDRFGEHGITALDSRWDYCGQLNDVSIIPVFRP